MFKTKLKAVAAVLILIVTGLAPAVGRATAQRQTDRATEGARLGSHSSRPAQLRDVKRPRYPGPARITWPFGVVVGTVFVNVGQAVKQGDRLLSVQSDELAAIKIRYRQARAQWLRDKAALSAWSAANRSAAKNIPVYADADGKNFIELQNDETLSRLRMKLAKDKLLVYGLSVREGDSALDTGDDRKFRLVVRSPIDGIVTLLVAKQGEAYNESAILMVVDPASPLSRLADIGPAPPTVLVASDGKPFDLAKLHGKVVLVSFIYTTCNGVCPLTTQALVGVEEKLKETKLWGKSVEFVSITLDPNRDTPRVLRDYARAFKTDPAAWHFLTGSPEKVNKVIKAWDMWVKSDSSGVLDHPSRAFLIDPRGRQREIYNLEFLKPEMVVEDVRDLVNEK
jgi:protein SCO1